MVVGIFLFLLVSFPKKTRRSRCHSCHDAPGDESRRRGLGRQTPDTDGGDHLLCALSVVLGRGAEPN